nr:hypothetical protein [uncultured Flavobacterium sp.]
MTARFLTVLFFAIVSSCRNFQIENSFQNKTQERFDNFLKGMKEKEYSASNDIQKMEYFRNFDTSLSRFLDSNKVFVNWNGTISNIKTREVDTVTIISCDISYNPEEYREVSFHCDHAVATSKVNYDTLYQKLKNISNFSTVFFDGYIIRDIDDKVLYDYGSDDLKVAYPNYKFNLLNITKESHCDTLSANLQQVINLNFQVVDLLKQKVKKVITDKEWEKQTKALNLDDLEDKLTPPEKAYSTRLKQYLFSDFLYR